MLSCVKRLMHATVIQSNVEATRLGKTVSELRCHARMLSTVMCVYTESED